MAGDYIRREDALFALRKAERGGSMTALTRLERAYAEIREMPAADIVEVVHGVWAENDDDTIECSCCNAVFDLVCLEPDDFRYCPHCGAKMDGGYER